MLGTHALGLFALTTLVVNLTPGVDLVMATTRTLQHGVRGGLTAAAGIAGGCALHALAAAFGLAALVAASAEAFSVLKVAGALYLAWLAAGMWRRAWSGRDVGAARAGEAPPATGAGGDSTAAPSRPPSVGSAPTMPTPTARPSAATLRRVFAQALASNLLNPKIAMFFLALLPQFIDAAAPSKTLAFLFLGSWFVVQGFVFLAVFSCLVAPLRRRPVTARVGRALHALGGTLFAGLALRLAVADRP